jgi:hypothetical protein
VAGFEEATDDHDIDSIELISVKRSFTRLYREGTYPPLRGTHFKMSPTRLAALSVMGSPPSNCVLFQFNLAFLKAVQSNPVFDSLSEVLESESSNYNDYSLPIEKLRGLSAGSRRPNAAT